jgi:hypothetical protein
MAVDVEGTIPPELMHAEAKPAVISFIRRLKVLPSVKRQILARWAYIVGADVDADDLRYVQVIQR